MLRKLQEDVFVFSKCKTHVQLKEVSTKLLDQNNKIQSWQNFSRDVKQIYKTYNDNYLQAEYIFATSSAEMAAKWIDAEQGGDRYNLQYRTAHDDRVRDSHARIEGTTLPVDDPFWDSYYPPNGWRCRCTAVQVRKEKYPVDNSAEKIRLADKVTVELDSKGRDRNAMFRFNPGKQKVVFPPNHPYYKVKDVLSSVMPSLVNDVTKRAYINESKKEYASFNENYKKDHFSEETGGYVVSHKNHFFQDNVEMKVGKILANQGERVVFLEEGIFKKKTPNFMMRGETWDIKYNKVNTSGAISDHIWHGKKARNVLFYFENGVDKTTLSEGYDRAIGKFKKEKIMKSLPRVYYMDGETLVRYK